MKKKTFAALLLALCMPLAACQPTPETPPVVNKIDGNMDKKIEESRQSTPPPNEVKVNIDVGAPERVTEEFKSESGKLDIIVDASVSVPQVDALPIIGVSPQQITQQEIDALAAYLFQGKPLIPIRMDGELTKQELLDQIEALRQEKDTGKHKSAEYQKTQEGIGLKSTEEMDAWFDEQIAKYEEQLKTAPETPELRASTALIDQGNGVLAAQASCDLGQKNPAEITASAQTLAFTNGGRTYYMVTGIPCPYGDPDLSRDDALTLAEDAVRVIAPNGELMLSDAMIGLYDGTDFTDPNAGAPDWTTADKAYVFKFLRNVGGAPTTYTGIDCVDSLGASGTMAEMFSYERVEVAVDESGIAQLFWYTPMTAGETLSENVEILPFDQIMETFRKMIKTKYAFVDDARKEYQVNNAEVHIERVVFGYTRLAVRDRPGEYMMAPVWDFFGYFSQEIEGEPGSKKELKNWSYDWSLLTINAVDGTTVDRNVGY